MDDPHSEFVLVDQVENPTAASALNLPLLKLTAITFAGRQTAP